PCRHTACLSYTHVPHPHLHSFPTRRSSDLSQQVPHPRARSNCLRRMSTHLAVITGLYRCLRTTYGRIVAKPCLYWGFTGLRVRRDRKSTRLNSSHLGISYAVFCLKKKKTMT